MKHLLFITSLSLLSLGLSFAQSEISVIPRPANYKLRSGEYRLSDATVIYYDTPALADEAALLSKMLAPAMGVHLKIKQGTGTGISLRTAKVLLDKLGAEGYMLESSLQGVDIAAATDTGVLWGCQTLRQLLPAEIYSRQQVSGVKWTLPSVEIVDKPRFSWRGMMLDSSRTFQSVEYIKEYIDRLSVHKINIFHWHLTDDQGWRLEVKAYPELTGKGSTWGGDSLLKPPHWVNEWLPEGEKYGGFYTQEQIREIVAYAAARKVQILPEIDLPGHSASAVAAYPEIACKGDDDSVSVQGEKRNVWCASRRENIAMMEQILREVSELFPFEYIHIGGDEVNHGPWRKCPGCNALAKEIGLKDGGQLQPWLTRQLEKICKKLGRKLVGWNEIMGKGISTDTCVMAWIGTGPGYTAASKGHPVVMAPGPFTYFDMPQGRGERGHFWAGVVTTDKTYSFDPLMNTKLTAEQLANIKGVQSCLWTEFCLERPDLLKKMGLTDNQALRGGSKKNPAPGGFMQHQTYPRLCALAEVGWTPQESRLLSDFNNRLGNHHLKRLYNMDIHYRVPTPRAMVNKDVVTIEPPWPGAKVFYALDGSEPTSKSNLYKIPFACENTGKLRMITQCPNGRESLVIQGAEIAPVGSWNSDALSAGKGMLSFDLSKTIKRPGNWRVEFVHKTGSSQLQIEGVAILENGKLISRDAHDSIIGASSVNAGGMSNYRIPLERCSSNARYEVRAKVSSVGGLDSSGIIKLSYSDMVEPDATAECSISVYQSNVAERAADWNRETFFWSSRPVRKGESFTWWFKSPVPPAEIEVKTGKPNTTHDILVDGKLQLSYDGNSFVDIADFAYGAAKGITARPVKALRVMVTGDQSGKWLAIQDPFIKAATLKPSAKVESNMPAYGNNTKEKTVDWDSSTYFWVSRQPEEGDHITWTFDKPVKAGSVEVRTGDPKKNGSDALGNGVLQISYDGRTFVDAAKFDRGVAVANPGRPLRALRLKVSGPQSKVWLKVQDPVLK